MDSGSLILEYGGAEGTRVLHFMVEHIQEYDVPRMLLARFLLQLNLCTRRGPSAGEYSHQSGIGADVPDPGSDPAFLTHAEAWECRIRPFVCKNHS